MASIDQEIDEVERIPFPAEGETAETASDWLMVRIGAYTPMFLDDMSEATIGQLLEELVVETSLTISEKRLAWIMAENARRADPERQKNERAQPRPPADPDDTQVPLPFKRDVLAHIPARALQRIGRVITESMLPNPKSPEEFDGSFSEK